MMRTSRKGCFGKVNELVWKWFREKRSRGVPISGPAIQEKALQIAKVLGETDFKVSNGWLEAFRKRHSITFRSISGEANTVDESMITEWNNRIHSLMKVTVKLTFSAAMRRRCFFEGCLTKHWQKRASPVKLQKWRKNDSQFCSAQAQREKRQFLW